MNSDIIVVIFLFVVLASIILLLNKRQEAKFKLILFDQTTNLNAALLPFNELLEEEEENEEDQIKQQEQLSLFIENVIGQALDTKLDGLKSAVNGSLGANTKALIGMEKLKAREDKEAMYEGMTEMLPGLETFLEMFNLTKSVKKNPDKLMEYVAIADMISGGKASGYIQQIQQMAAGKMDLHGKPINQSNSSNNQNSNRNQSFNWGQK